MAPAMCDNDLMKQEMEEMAAAMQIVVRLKVSSEGQGCIVGVGQRSLVGSGTMVLSERHITGIHCIDTNPSGILY